MSYEPWPEDGCTLAEARERTIAKSASTAETEPNFEFLSLLRSQRLVAYGRKIDLKSDSQLIPKSEWTVLTRLNWTKSTAGENKPGGSSFCDIKVYPLVLADCRVALIAGQTLSQAFGDCVLKDPEVAALGRLAVKTSPAFDRVFNQGCCFARGCNEWPLGEDRHLTGVIHPDESKRSAIGFMSDPDPQIVADATDALQHRFDEFFGLLRRGELVGRGVSATSGQEEAILRSVWSNNDFWFNARARDVLQVNPNCEEPERDFLIVRWLAVILDRSVTPAQSLGSTHASSPCLEPQTSSSTSLQLAFSAADLINAGSFGPGLRTLVFNHPANGELLNDATAAAEKRNDPFYRDAGLLTHCFGYEGKLLPIKASVKGDDELEAISDDLLDSMPGNLVPLAREIYRYYFAIWYHVWSLFELLRQRKVIAIGHLRDGDRIAINHTIWSHPLYFVDPETSDVYEAGPGTMIKRWVGVIFEKADGTVSDSQRIETIRPAKKAISQVETKSSSLKACGQWLREAMRASPTIRTGTKRDWWLKAKERWPGTLTDRAFQRSWSEAVEETGASAWSAAGAPKGARKPRT